MIYHRVDWADLGAWLRDLARWFGSRIHGYHYIDRKGRTR